MTHLSDFSFLQRMVSFGYLYVWFLYRVWTLDRFSCLLPKRFKQGELKSIVTLLILFMIPFQLFYDITSVKIKYEEGFANVLGHVFTKPEVMWTKADKALVIPTEYSLCIGFSLQTGTLVLLQCFWNYLANSVARASFMSSKEFMFYIFWTCSSFIVFPVLQYNFSRDIYEPTYKEIMPEMVYGIELFIVACLGVVSNFRFKRLLNSSRDTVNGRSISQKIRYFQEVNLVLSTVLFGHGTLLTILSCDGLTSRKTLNIHKFSADFFICNINMCAVITWFCMILIFHPKHSNSPTPDDETLADDPNKQPVNNNSGISSNYYTHASTLIPADSQISSDYLYKEGSIAVHPLSKSGNTSQATHCDSALQFGPLPTTPPVTSEIVYCRKNNSIISAAPSMTTLVSHRQQSLPNIYHGGSQGKNHHQYVKDAADYFPVAIEKEEYHKVNDYNQEAVMHELDVAVSQKRKTSKSLVLQPICDYKEIEMHQPPYKQVDMKEEEEYVQAPLSPARKNRDIVHSIRSTDVVDQRRYTHSMISAPCNEDMGEFGLNHSKELKPKEEETFHFQKQQAMLTSFKEFGEAKKQMSMSHSTSSLLLPLPFEYGSSQSLSSQDNMDPLHSGGLFDFLPPPPSGTPPPTGSLPSPPSSWKKVGN